MTAQLLHRMLVDAGVNVRQVADWETRGGSWRYGRPVGVMEHHTSVPVPYPVDRLHGSLLKCNMNTKPNGEVWLVAFGACNYSSGSGSSVVLAEVLNSRAPTRNARDRGLSDDTNGNPIFWNFENDHAGRGGPMPDVQHRAIIVATRVVNDYFDLTAGSTISHAEWTSRKSDPYWNGDRRAIETIRERLEDDMGPSNWTEEDWAAFISRAGWGSYPGGPAGASAWQTVSRTKTTLDRIKLAGLTLGSGAAGGIVTEIGRRLMEGG